MKLTKKFQSSYGKISYDSFGSGPDVILVHGTPFYSYVWRQVVQILSAKFTFHVYDLLGYGNSEKSSDLDVSLGVQNKILVELINHLHLKVSETYIVGHDFGGATVLRTLVINKFKFKKVILIDCVALSPWGSPFVQHVRQYYDAFRNIPPYIHKAIVSTYIQDAIEKKLSDEEMLPYISPWLGEIGQAAFYQQIAQMDQKYTDEIQNSYGSISIPVTILWAKNDGWIPVAKGKELHDLIPNSRFFIVNNAKHLVQEDNPSFLIFHINEFFSDK